MENVSIFILIFVNKIHTYGTYSSILFCIAGY